MKFLPRNWYLKLGTVYLADATFFCYLSLEEFCSVLKQCPNKVGEITYFGLR